MIPWKIWGVQGCRDFKGVGVLCIYSIFCTHRRTLQARMLEWLGSFCAVRGCLLKHQETCRTSPLQITTSGLDMSIDMDPSHQWVEIIQLVFICWRWIAQEMEIPKLFLPINFGQIASRPKHGDLTRKQWWNRSRQSFPKSSISEELKRFQVMMQHAAKWQVGMVRGSTSCWWIGTMARERYCLWRCLKAHVNIWKSKEQLGASPEKDFKQFCCLKEKVSRHLWGGHFPYFSRVRFFVFW